MNTCVSKSTTVCSVKCQLLHLYKGDQKITNENSAEKAQHKGDPPEKGTQMKNTFI